MNALFHLFHFGNAALEETKNDTEEVQPDGLSPIAREARAEEIFAKLKKYDAPALKIWLREMPKGGDLHIHLAGAIYSETFLEIAEEHGLYFNIQTCLFADREEGEDCIPAKEVPANPKALEQYLNAISMRVSSTVTKQSGHDHFMYACFCPIFSIISYVKMDVLIEKVRRQARMQNIEYLELMVSLKGLQTLSESFEQMHFEKEEPLTKYIAEISRVQPDDGIFEKEVQEAMELMQKHPQHIVSFNIVGPEDHPTSRSHFKAQMGIIDALWRKNPMPITLHGGELTQDLSPPDDMKKRIRTTLNKGRCQRLGHGVSITEENRALDLLKEMRENHRAVEVCLSSNEKILKVEGETHPIHTYLNHGVPVVLGSDDPGVNRADLSEQFFIAAYRHNIPYSKIKWMVRNSLEFAFMQGESIFVERNTLKFHPLFEGVEKKLWEPSSAASELLEHSEKAKEQVKLERLIVAFEEKLLAHYGDY